MTDSRICSGLFYSDKNRSGGVVDARPESHRVYADRNGDFWQYGHKIGDMTYFVQT